MSRFGRTCIQVDAQQWLSFGAPVEIVRVSDADAVRPALAALARRTVAERLYAVGFVSYEAGRAFGLAVHDAGDRCPLLWFGLYPAESVHVAGAPTPGDGYTLGAVTPRLTRAGFAEAFARIKAHIADGDTYQVNFTFQSDAAFQGDPASLFADLVEAQGSRYSVLVDTGDLAVCSASPELFFDMRHGTLRARPMKGTARRAPTPDRDAAARDRLAASTKERAENVMVVDMVRNDLGRIAETGSVRVEELFTVERYPGVWQMTSQVTARSAAGLDAVFEALHPSASITGAPKVRTMEIVRALEQGPRGVYTGAVGHVAPDGTARFNVAIRTAVVDRAAGRVSFGIGSGIVWDSDADAEYDECLLKGSILGQRPVRFDLLETILWTPASGFVLLDRHLARLAASAGYFGRTVSPEAVREALQRAVSNAGRAQRVRLLVEPGGQVRVETRDHVPVPGPVRLRLAAAPVDSRSVWLHHKTTHRSVYDEARASAGECDDVVLWNERGEVCETTIANLVVEVGGERLTPPVSAGLLAGTCRAELLDSGDVREAPVSVDVFRAASRLWVINSVQGERPAVLIS